MLSQLVACVVVWDCRKSRLAETCQLAERNCCSLNTPLGIVRQLNHRIVSRKFSGSYEFSILLHEPTRDHTVTTGTLVSSVALAQYRLTVVRLRMRPRGAGRGEGEPLSLGSDVSQVPGISGPASRERRSVVRVACGWVSVEPTVVDAGRRRPFPSRGLEAVPGGWSSRARAR